MIDRTILCLVGVLSVLHLLYNIASSYAIRGNELKHVKELIEDTRRQLCNKIDKVEERIERLENHFIKSE